MATRRASGGWAWPVVIVSLLVVGAGANVGFLIVASGDASFAVEPDYYRKAVAWDAVMEQEARNAALGWTVSARIEAAEGRARLVAGVRDRSGAPVTGATVGLEAFPSARASQVAQLTLAPAGDGVYTGWLPAARAGLWELRFRVTRGGEVFTRTLGQDLAAGP